MARIPTQHEVYALHRAAYRADDAFHAEVIRQFGADRAATMRYVVREHDERTSFARDQYQTAMEAWRIAFRHRNAVEALQAHA
jgi:hypothetical protein